MEDYEIPDEFLKIIMSAEEPKKDDSKKPGHRGPLNGAPAADKDPVKLLETIHTMIAEFLMDGSADAAIKRGMEKPEGDEPKEKSEKPEEQPEEEEEEK